jgi:predicted nucleic acid-binding protein
MIRKRKVFVDAGCWVALLDKNSPDYLSSREKYKELANQGVVFYSSNISVSMAIAELRTRVSKKIADEFYSFLINSEATGQIKLVGYNKKYFRDTMDLYLEYSEIFGERIILPLNLVICRNKKIRYFFTVNENKEKLKNIDWVEFI